MALDGGGGGAAAAAAAGGGAGDAAVGGDGGGASGSQSRTANAFVWPEVERRLLKWLVPIPGEYLSGSQKIPYSISSTLSWRCLKKFSLDSASQYIFDFWDGQFFGVPITIFL